MDSLPFKAEMIRAIQNTRPNVWPAQPIDPALPFKWQTRRGVKLPSPQFEYILSKNYKTDGTIHKEDWTSENVQNWIDCPYGQPGSRLWARETWATTPPWDNTKPSSLPPHGVPIFYFDDNFGGYKKRPSIFMPRWASRFCLEIKGIRVERVQDISEADAVAEGVGPNNHYYCDEGDELDPTPIHRCDPVGKYVELWDKINGKRPGCSWQNNPRVWVIEFMRVE